MRPRPEGRGELVTPAALAAQAGFNAATTRRPWRTTRAEIDQGWAVSASMRPRPEGRGEPIEADPCDSPPGRFNAATTRRPWRTIEADPCDSPPGASMRPRPEGRGELPFLTFRAGVTAALQCGHDPKAVENSNGVGQRGDYSPRFNAATTRRPWRTKEGRVRPHGGRCASMRPRPEGRGELQRARAGRRNACGLQCGHDPKAVENYSARSKRSVSGFRLQCGHDPKAVENSEMRSISHAPNAWLQCGHDPKAVENPGT